jgi:hypothetical protein
MANIIYRKGTTPIENVVTANKGSPLSNDELDGNFIGLNTELTTKAPINNAVFTGSTTIPLINATGGQLNDITIGALTPSTGAFTTVTTTGNITVGGAGTILAQSGASASPSIARNGDPDTGIWFPAANTIAVSAGGSERIRATSSLVTITGNQSTTGTLSVGSGTTLSSTLAVNGAATFSNTIVGSNTIQGTRFISTQSTGTAPLTVASTTLVTNLNADKVDNLDFATVNTSGTSGVDQTGGVAYAVNSTNVSFVPPGPTGRLLQSNGVGAAPTWVTPTGLTAGNSDLAANILGGSAGQILYQGGPDLTNKLPIGATNTVLRSNGTIPEWTNTLTLSGTVTHGGLVPSAGTAIDQVYQVTESLTVTTAWVNTSINATELANGSYMVQVTSGSEFYTGIMSWFGNDINSALVDEIILHKASSGTETGNLFLRVERTDNDASPDMTLQISSSVTRTSASYTFKFRRLI